jgi:hypothetical protein
MAFGSPLFLQQAGEGRDFGGSVDARPSASARMPRVLGLLRFGLGPGGFGFGQRGLGPCREVGGILQGLRGVSDIAAERRETVDAVTRGRGRLSQPRRRGGRGFAGPPRCDGRRPDDARPDRPEAPSPEPGTFALAKDVICRDGCGLGSRQRLGMPSIAAVRASASVSSVAMVSPASALSAVSRSRSRASCAIRASSDATASAARAASASMLSRST